MDFYDEVSLSQIVKRSAVILKMDLNETGAKEIARRGRGTPRMVNHLLKRIRDYAQVEGKSLIDGKLACYALDQLGVNQFGLNQTDMEILKMIHKNFSGGPVGIDTLSAGMNEESDTLEDFYEPYLLRQGLIQKTPRGRILTDKGQAVVISGSSQKEQNARV